MGRSVVAVVLMLRLQLILFSRNRQKDPLKAFFENRDTMKLIERLIISKEAPITK